MTKSREVNECNKVAQPVVIAREGLHVSKVWYCEMIQNEGDAPIANYLACVRQDDEGDWIYIYRFRYYDRPHLDAQYVAQFDDEKTAVSMGNSGADIILEHNPGSVVEGIPVNSSSEKTIIQIMTAQPWACVHEEKQ